MFVVVQELAAKLREILSLKRQYDDVPAQTELIQYVVLFDVIFDIKFIIHNSSILDITMPIGLSDFQFYCLHY